MMGRVTGLEESASLPRQEKDEQRKAEKEGQTNQQDKYDEYNPYYSHGDLMLTKQENICHIVSFNLNGYAKTTDTTMDRTKNKLLRDIIQHSRVDAMLTQEDNTYWPALHAEHRPAERFR